VRVAFVLLVLSSVIAAITAVAAISPVLSAFELVRAAGSPADLTSTLTWVTTLLVLQAVLSVLQFVFCFRMLAGARWSRIGLTGIVVLSTVAGFVASISTASPTTSTSVPGLLFVLALIAIPIVAMWVPSANAFFRRRPSAARPAAIGA
jgi:hypothetical protein